MENPTLRRINTLYYQLVRYITLNPEKIKLDENNEFYWRKNPIIQSKVNELLFSFNTEVTVLIQKGMDTAWGIANDEYNALTKRIYGGFYERFPHYLYKHPTQ